MDGVADPEKVKDLANSIAEIGLQEPVRLASGHIRPLVYRRGMQSLRTLTTPQIDILEVEGQYYGFSGCHRYEVG